MDPVRSDAEADESFQRYQECMQNNVREIDRLHGLTVQLEGSMKLAEEEHYRLARLSHSQYELDLPNRMDLQMVREELEWTRRRMEQVQERLSKLALSEKKHMREIASVSFVDGSQQTEVGSHSSQEKKTTVHIQETVAEPPPDYDDEASTATSTHAHDSHNGVTMRDSHVKVEESLETLTQQETDQAVAILEEIKQKGTVDTEAGRELLHSLAADEKLAQESRGTPKKSNLKKRQSKDKLAMLREDLMANRDVTRLTPEDITLLQYQLQNGKYKTRTLKQIRQGNTRHRVSLFEQL